MKDTVKLETEKGLTFVVRTNVDFVRHVENTLGFVLEGEPHWKRRQIEAGKLKRKRNTNPELYSMENLLLTVEWLRQRKREVKSPAAVCWFVDEALENARSEPDVDELEARVQAATVEAYRSGEREWAARLVRSQGNARAEVLAEWEHAHG